MKAMVLCAGLGTRLRPLTLSVPKPLVPAPDRPLVFRTLDRLADAGAELFVVNLHHLPGKVREAIGAEWRGIRVEYTEELPEILGPTGGLRNAIDHFGGEPFIVANGDVYFEMDFRALFDFHVSKGTALTMAVKTDSPDSKINAVAFDEQNIVRQLWGKPEWNGGPLSAGINAGAFVYDPDIIRRFVPPGVPYGFREDFMPALFEAGVRVAAFPYRGFWSDIGDNESYLRFVCAALRGEVPGIDGGHTVAASARIDPEAEVIPPCRIGENCIVEKGARVGPCVVLGENATIGAATQLKECVAAPGVSILDKSEFTNQIIV